MKFNTKEERDEFIIDNMGLVNFIINKYLPVYKLNIGENSFEEALQIGYVGLIKAVNNFDENRNYTFSAFATKCIIGEILMSVRETKNGVRYGRKILTNKKRIEEYSNYMTVNEIAKKVNLSEDEIIKIKDIDFNPRYINQMIVTDENELENNSFEQLKVNVDFNERLILNDILNELSEKNKNMVIDYVFNDYTQREIGEKYGCMQQVAGRRIKKALNKLKDVV